MEKRVKTVFNYSAEFKIRVITAMWLSNQSQNGSKIDESNEFTGETKEKPISFL